MQYYDSLVDLVGNTPLVKLNTGRAEACRPTVLAKVEYFNPGGSVKDRIALRMIEAAEESGELQAGRHHRRADLGQHRRRAGDRGPAEGLPVRLRLPDKVSQDKINVLEAYGARIEVCPTAVAPEDPRSYYNVSDRLVREIAGAWKPDQYANANNPRSHYETTGPEIWEQTEGRVTHFVPASAPAAPSAAPAATSRRCPRGGSRSSAPTPRARSTPAAPAARTSSRASARTSGPTPTTARSPTRSSPCPTATPS